MDTLNTGFIWEYDDNSFEEKNLLIDTLPEGFKYRVKKLKIIKKSDVKEEVKFQTLVPLQEYQPFFCLNLKNQHKEFDFLFFLNVSMCPWYFLILSEHCQHKQARNKGKRPQKKGGAPEFWCPKFSWLLDVHTGF